MTPNHTLACLGLVSLLFGTAAGADEVTIGRGGSGSTQSDTDLIVHDPFFLSSETEPNFFFNASAGDLTLGSGNAGQIGDDGDILVETGSGTTGVSIGGNGAFIALGVFGNAGDVFIRDSGGLNEIVLSGGTGSVTNEIGGDGLVKAWCRVNADGTFAAGFRCNSSGTETQSLALGTYEVDFSALSTDISARPHVVSCSDDGTFVSCTEITSVVRFSDSSSLFIQTKDSAGTPVDSAFTVVIF